MIPNVIPVILSGMARGITRVLIAESSVKRTSSVPRVNAIMRRIKIILSDPSLVRVGSPIKPMLGRKPQDYIIPEVTDFFQ
jgi:hypothetical protein